jgi:hypothetical protein
VTAGDPTHFSGRVAEGIRSAGGSAAAVLSDRAEFIIGIALRVDGGGSIAAA